MLSMVLKYFLSNPLYSLIYVLQAQVLSVLAFDKKTLSNVHNYLVSNKDLITWEINESGFVRTKFPNEVLNMDNPVFSTLKETDYYVRGNFWYGPFLDASINLRDAAAHDHPNGFISYIVAQGYTHATYKVVAYTPTQKNCPAELPKSESQCADFFIYDKKNNKLTSNGVAYLSPSEFHSTTNGTIVIFDDNAIHRIEKYQMNTMSLNIVRRDGKYQTNLFVFPQHMGTAKNARKVIANDQALVITEKSIAIYQDALSNMGESQENKGHILNYKSNPISLSNLSSSLFSSKHLTPERPLVEDNNSNEVDQFTI